MIESIKTQRKAQIGVLIAFAVILSGLYINFTLAPGNSTPLAFSYEYGFTSRGLLGSIYHLVCLLFPALYSAKGAVIFSFILSGILYSLTIFIISRCILKVDEHNSYLLFLIAFFLLWFMCPMFVGFCNLGRLDVLSLIFTILACFTILYDKYIYLCIPLCALGVLTHEGYVFMFSGIILALLFYRLLKSQGKKSFHYGIVFAITFIVISILFVWFSFINKGVAAPYYDVIKSDAIMLNQNGEVFDDVLTVTILGEDIRDMERRLIPTVFMQFLVFALMMIPYIIFVAKFFINLIKNASSIKDKLSYLALSLGIVTIVPELMMKLDYARWSFCIIFYYALVIIIAGSIDNYVMENIKRHLIPKSPLINFFLLVYPVVFQPLLDANISLITMDITNSLITLIFG